MWGKGWPLVGFTSPSPRKRRAVGQDVHAAIVHRDSNAAAKTEEGSRRTPHRTTMAESTCDKGGSNAPLCLQGFPLELPRGGGHKMAQRATLLSASYTPHIHTQACTHTQENVTNCGAHTIPAELNHVGQGLTEVEKVTPPSRGGRTEGGPQVLLVLQALVLDEMRLSGVHVWVPGRNRHRICEPDSRPARTLTQCGGTVYPSRDNSGSSSAVMRVSSGAVKGHAGKGLRLVLPSVLPVARFVPDALLLCTQLASAGS